MSMTTETQPGAVPPLPRKITDIGIFYLAAYDRPHRTPTAYLETDSKDRAAEWRTVQEMLGRTVLPEGEPLPVDW